MDSNLFRHDDDGDSIDDFLDSLGGSASININLPVAETLSVNGPRQVPLVVTISNKAERNPRRDAKMLATFLTCSLDEQTVYFLTEYLFNEHMAPLVTETKQYLAAMQNSAAQVVTKKKPTRGPKNDSKDQ